MKNAGNNISNNPTKANPNFHMQQTEILSAKTLIAVAIVFLYTISSPIMHKFKFYVMHESGISMIIGVIITVGAMIFNPDTTFANTLDFDDAIFFTFILPPIIFSAGYNLKRKSFFKFIPYTLLFGVLGTFISFLIISSFSFTLNYFSLFSSDHKVLHLSIQEILLFSCVISSTDTLSALTFIKEESDSKLFSILFGEGVFNDAVSVVLYKIITDFAYSKEEFTPTTPFVMLWGFIKLFLLSLAFGILVGLVCTIFLKQMKNFKLDRVQECSIIIFFAFMSYTAAELLALSPIISLLFTAVFMSHYSFYNLSFQAREESSIVAKIMANIAEAFVFTYLGLTFVTMSHNAFSLNFLIAEFVIVIAARYTAVYSISAIINLFNSTSYIIKPSERAIMSFAGSIRGAIAFGLAMGIQTGFVKNDEVLVSTTLILVFVTTIVFGALLPLLIDYHKKADSEYAEINNEAINDVNNQMDELNVNSPSNSNKINKNSQELTIHHKTDYYSHGTFEYTYSHPNNRFDIDYKNDEEHSFNSIIKYPEEHNNNNVNKPTSFFERVKQIWNRFDNNVIKPWLLHNWPQSKIEHEEITVKIKSLFKEYQKVKGNKKKRVIVKLEEDLDNDNEEVDVCISSGKIDDEEEKLENI